MESNIVERAIKTEVDTRTEQKGVGKLDCLMSKAQTQHPHHVKVSLDQMLWGGEDGGGGLRYRTWSYDQSGSGWGPFIMHGPLKRGANCQQAMGPALQN